MKILLLGAMGQVGWELQRALLPLGELIVCDRKSGDLEDLDGLRNLIHSHSPNVIVNAAAYTAVDKAESEKELAFRINAEAVDVLADEAKKMDALLVHYSTDYVFDGSSEGAWQETDETNPLNVYGQTKLQGENFVRKSGCRHLIFRTSWVYGFHGHNFVKTILRIAKEKDELKIVSDQKGAPTSAELIADVTALALCHIKACKGDESALWGTYHLSPGGVTSWCDYAKFVVRKALEYGQDLKLSEDNVLPIPSCDYPVPAQRPANSFLNNKKLSCTFSLKMPEWQVQVERVVRELC